MLKSIFIVFYVKGFSKWCIIFIKIIFLGISLPMGRWAICAGKQKNSLICMVGCFQVTTQNFLLFVTFKGVLSKLSYVKPNPCYSLFCELGVLCYQYYINSWMWLQNIYLKHAEIVQSHAIQVIIAKCGAIIELV